MSIFQSFMNPLVLSADSMKKNCEIFLHMVKIEKETICYLFLTAFIFFQSSQYTLLYLEMQFLITVLSRCNWQARQSTNLKCIPQWYLCICIFTGWHNFCEIRIINTLLRSFTLFFFFVVVGQRLLIGPCRQTICRGSLRLIFKPGPNEKVVSSEKQGLRPPVGYYFTSLALFRFCPRMWHSRPLNPHQSSRKQIPSWS